MERKSLLSSLKAETWVYLRQTRVGGVMGTGGLRVGFPLSDLWVSRDHGR